MYFGWSALNVGQHPDVCELLVLHDPRLPQCCLRHRTVKIEIPICQTRYIGSPGRAGLWLNQGMSLWGQYDFFNCISLSPVLQYTIGLRPKKLIKLDLWECHKFASSGLALARIFAVKTQHKTLLVTRNVLTLEKAKRAKKTLNSIVPFKLLTMPSFSPERQRRIYGDPHKEPAKAETSNIRRDFWQLSTLIANISGRDRNWNYINYTTITTSPMLAEKNDELWSTNKKVIVAHVDPLNRTFSGDYISALSNFYTRYNPYNVVPVGLATPAWQHWP